MKELSPRETNKTVQRDLLSILQPLDHFRSGMRRQVGDVAVRTQPFGTEFQGVCRRDVVSLFYAPVEPTTPGADVADTVVRPYKIEATAEFHIVTLPPPDAPKAPLSQTVWQVACERVGHDEKANWFSAGTADEAVDAARLLMAAVDQIKAGTLKAKPCPYVFDRKQTCDQAILDVADLTKINAIQDCPAAAGDVCFSIQLAGMTDVMIVARSQAVGPAQIESITVGQFVIVT